MKSIERTEDTTAARLRAELSLSSTLVDKYLGWSVEEVHEDARRLIGHALSLFARLPEAWHWSFPAETAAAHTDTAATAQPASAYWLRISKDGGLNSPNSRPEAIVNTMGGVGRTPVLMEWPQAKGEPPVHVFEIDGGPGADADIVFLCVEEKTYPFQFFPRIYVTDPLAEPPERYRFVRKLQAVQLAAHRLLQQLRAKWRLAGSVSTPQIAIVDTPIQPGAPYCKPSITKEVTVNEFN